MEILKVKKKSFVLSFVNGGSMKKRGSFSHKKKMRNSTEMPAGPWGGANKKGNLKTSLRNKMESELR